MRTYNKDGSPRKKTVTKKMQMAKNRANGQKKAWATRKARYPETNGFKPQMVDADLEKSMNQGLKVSAPISTVKAEPIESLLTPDVLEKLIQLEDFLNDIPGNNFNRDQFIANAIINAINSALAIQGVTLVTKD